MTDALDCLEINPGSDADAAVIWMHGLGATYRDFVDVPPHLGLPETLAVRFIFPQAPSIPVTLNGGMVMPAWYDIRSLDTRGQDEPGIRRSAESITALVDRQVGQGIPSSRIVIGGFSMGAAMALHVGLRHAEQLAGIMVLSGYLVLAETVDDEASEANRRTPIFAAHGTRDMMLPVELGQRSRDHLVERGYEIAWHEYPIEHSVSMPEITDVGAWIGQVLG